MNGKVSIRLSTDFDITKIIADNVNYVDYAQNSFKQFICGLRKEFERRVIKKKSSTTANL